MLRIERKIKTVGKLSDYLKEQKEPKPEVNMAHKIMTHFEENQSIYISAGLTLLFVFGCGFDVASAAEHGYTKGVIDREAKIVYKDLVDIGKWLIIGKGGWEVISSTLKNDSETAKRKFIGYLIAYVCLLGLPFAFDKVDSIFYRMSGA